MSLEYFDIDLDYLQQGPEIFSAEFKTANRVQWNRLGKKLWVRFQNDPHWPARIHQYYLPLFSWLSKTLIEIGLKGTPIIVGVNGPQGVGKSTLGLAFVELFAELGIRAASLSIDDFYLTHEEQKKLAARNPENPLLQKRGYPGTHDIALGITTLQALKEISPSETLLVPLYSKSAFQGQGDRLPKSEWKNISAPLDIVLLDGWMLGYPPVLKSELPGADFIKVNELLREYQSWDRFLDVFVELCPEKISFIPPWRIEAEEKMKASGKDGMSRPEIETYMQMFVPAYETYLPALAKNPPVKKYLKRVILNKDRLPGKEN